MPVVLQINVASNKGSTGKIAENIGLTAKREGWDSYIVHGKRYAGNTELNDISCCNTFSEFIHYVISLLFDAQGRASYLSTRRIVKQIRALKPDIVHIHNIHGYYINYRLLFNVLYELNIPVVWTLHDCWAFTGHCVYFDRIKCEKWKELCHGCPQIDTYPKSCMDRSLANFKLKRALFSSIPNLTLVPVSCWLSNLVDESFLSDLPRKVIHNGIDLSLFKPVTNNLRDKLGVSSKKVILGVADGFGVRKGLEDFIELSQLLNDEYQIILIGVSNEDCVKVPKSIMSFNRTSNQSELVEFYTIADVYVNPTYEDNFPTTNIEALACGTPVITYNTGGSPEAVDANTGRIVEKGNVKSLYDSIIYVCGLDREDLREKCRSRALDNYDMNSKFKEYISLYSDLVSK